MDTGEKFLFDLAQDPAEQRKLYPSREAELLERRLRRNPEPRYGAEMDLTEEEREALRQLGYIE